MCEIVGEGRLSIQFQGLRFPRRYRMVSFYYSHNMKLTFSGGFFILFCFVFLINRALVIVIKLDISNI